MDTPRPPEARFPCLPVEGPVPSPPPGWTWEGLMAEALAERIRFALAHPRTRAAVAEAATAEVHRRYGIDRVAGEIRALYGNMVE